jgi:hypothetical protein
VKAKQGSQMDKGITRNRYRRSMLLPIEATRKMRNIMEAMILKWTYEMHLHDKNKFKPFVRLTKLECTTI